MPEVIRVRGAREHNLKNVDVEIPRDKRIEQLPGYLYGQVSLVLRLIRFMQRVNVAMLRVLVATQGSSWVLWISLTWIASMA